MGKAAERFRASPIYSNLGKIPAIKAGMGIMIMFPHSDGARISDPRSRWTLLAACAVLMAAWPLGANAQINPFAGYKGPTLPKQDLATGRAAAKKLLIEDQAEVGRSEDWTGPTSGNQGSISVQKAFKRQGRECRTLRSEIRYRRSDHPRVLNLDVCRLQTGEWKLM